MLFLSDVLQIKNKQLYIAAGFWVIYILCICRLYQDEAQKGCL